MRLFMTLLFCVSVASADDYVVEVAPKPVLSEPRPFRCIMWSPTWCGVCRSNKKLLTTGEQLVEIPFKLEIRQSDDATLFPKEVQAFANGTFPAGTDCAGQQRGWPVWQIELADGSWGFAHHARSADDLVAIHRLKRGEPVPNSTFTEAWKRLNKPAMPKPQEKPGGKRISGPVATVGKHSHKCSRCNVEWWHGAEAANNPRAHNCPRCGRAEFVVFRKEGE